MKRAACILMVTGSLWHAAASNPNDPWLRIRSANFELMTTGGEHSGRDLITHFEHVRGFFLQVFGLQSTAERPVRIVAFHNDKEFRPYSPSEAAAAFYHHGGEHDYIVMRSAGNEHYQVATHEYTHLLIGQFKGSIPLWLNEGLAELYSTIEQVGDKIAIGVAPTGRADVLLNDAWIPLDALFSTASDSPLYNEKSRAGMFYAESWALVHMLNLDPEYHAHLKDLLDALKTADSAAAFRQAYGKSTEQVQADLGEYVNRRFLHGVAFAAPPAKSGEMIEVEPHSGMTARLALAEMVSEYPGRAQQADEMYRELAEDYPDRWPVEAALGRFAWRERHNQEALTHFARAAELGATDARMFLDYGRALTAVHPDESLPALRRAVALDSGLQEAHLELGLALLRSNEWHQAISELQIARPLKPWQAPQYFYGMGYSAYRLGDRIAARNYVEQGRTLAKIPEEVTALKDLSDALGPPVAEGVLESIECQGKVARLHVRIEASEHLFLIPDMSLAKELSCGPAADIAVRIEFQSMPMGTSSADGIVRLLAFK
jgi:tetratricopeptide (TPR) repeat protein